MVQICTDSTWVKTNSGPRIILFGRDYIDRTKTVKTVVDNIEPYFYVPGTTTPFRSSTPEGLRRVEEREYTDALGRCVRKAFVHLPSDVPKVRDFYDYTCEADIPFDKRYLVDSGIVYAYEEGADGPRPVDVPSAQMPRVTFLDIEVKGDPGKIPTPEEAAWPIVSIQCLDSYTKKIVIFTYGVPQVAPDQVACESEVQLLRMFVNYIKDTDPDVLSAWYGNFFDLPYIIRRAEVLQVDMREFGRTYARPMARKEGNDWRLRVTGRQCFDLLAAFKKYYAPMGGLEAYDLKSVVANTDVIKDRAFAYSDYGDKINELFEREEWPIFLQYCRNDVIALDTIDTSLKLIEFFEGIRMIAGVKLEETLMNSRVIESLLMRNGIKPMPTKRYDKPPAESFEGALVIKPPLGIHENVGVVDLAALYPNIIVGFDISPDIDHVVPRVIKTIMEEREKLRALKNAGLADDVTKNKEQVMKYLANSFYGVIGWDKFRLYNVEQAAFVTRTGRELNQFLQEEARKCGLEPIYGDSVCKGTRISVNGANIPIEELFTSIDYTIGDKEYCNLTNIYADTLDENDIHCNKHVPYIMRHKCKKLVYRLWFTSYEYLDVTEDHSIFGYVNKNKGRGRSRLELITPTDIGGRIKSLIKQRYKCYSTKSMGFDSNKYEILGYYAGDGSISGYYKSKPYYMALALGSDANELYDTLISPSKFIITDYKIRDKGDLIFRCEDPELLNKMVHKWMFNETNENICAYLRGVFSADGTVLIRNNAPIVRMTTINNTFAEDIQQLLLRVGIASSIFKEGNTNKYNGKDSGTYSHHVVIKNVKRFKESIGFLMERKNNRLSFISRMNKQFDCKDYSLTKVIKIEQIDYDDYVYDIEVEDTHRYFANGILVHNTDSVFMKGVKSPESGLILQSHLNERLAEWSNEHGSSVNFTLKFEKFYRKIIFKRAVSGDVAKKNYAGHLTWKDGKVENKLDTTGIGLKRSDQSHITKDILRNFLERILLHDDEEGALKNVKDTVANVLAGKVSPHDVSIPKGVKNTERNDPWVRGMKNTQRVFNMSIPQGIKPRLLYCLGQITEICITDDMDEATIRSKVVIDWPMCCEKTVEKKMRTFIESIGKSWEKVILGQTSLAEWSS